MALHARGRACSAALLVSGLLAAPGLAVEPVGPGEATPPPALVVLIAVDQLRRDRLTDELPGGLGRLVRDGRVYVEGVLDHSSTETCPGHATMLSGRHPGALGVPGNSYIARETGERVYCVEDRADDATVLGGNVGDEWEPSTGRSPRSLRGGGLGGWMKEAWPGTRVFSVSGKDRAAIAMVGRDADVAWWVARKRGGFTTSRYYRDTLPDWVAAWNAASLSEIPATWTHAPEGTARAGVSRADDFAGESDERSRTSPHPLNAGDAEERSANLWQSPYLDALTFDFARRLVENEDLGGGVYPDLLAISASATDTVGHGYGPDSAEARDALARLDLAVGTFVDFLDARLGPNRVVIALTADHGVLALPEWLAATGDSECPVEGGRQGLLGLSARLLLEMHFELSPFSWPGSWLDVSGQLMVNRARARAQDVPVERAIAVAERWLEEQPVIREVWTQEEIRGGVGPMATLYQNSLDPERSGDLAIELEPGCLIDFQGAGTTHGSPHEYDRAVPIVFYGPGVVPGRVPGPAATVDIGPTLAGLIGLAPPDGLDGRDLLERPSE
jgi:hypothetical protein